MKKFSKIENEQPQAELTTQADIISALIDESLKIENNTIVGKEQLAEMFQTLLDMTQSNGVIKAYESVKMNAYKYNNLEWIEDSIIAEKKKLGKKKKSCDCGCDCDGDGECNCECKKDKKLIAKKNGISSDKIDESFNIQEEQIIQESNIIRLKTNENVLGDIMELSKLMESIVDVDVDLTRQEKTNIILEKMSDYSYTNIIIGYLSVEPEYYHAESVNSLLQTLTDDKVSALYDLVK